MTGGFWAALTITWAGVAAITLGMLHVATKHAAPDPADTRDSEFRRLVATIDDDAA